MAPSQLPDWAKSPEAHDELRKICDLDQKDRENKTNAYWTQLLSSGLKKAFDLMIKRSNRFNPSRRQPRHYKVPQVGGVGVACSEWLMRRSDVDYIWAVHDNEKLAKTGLRFPDGDGASIFSSGDIGTCRALETLAPKGFDFIVINATFINPQKDAEVLRRADKLLTQSGVLLVQYLHPRAIEHFGVNKIDGFSIDVRQIKSESETEDNASLYTWDADSLLYDLLRASFTVRSFDICELKGTEDCREYFRSIEGPWPAIFSLITACSRCEY